MNKYQGAGIYQLADGKIAYCELGGQVDASNVILRNSSNLPIIAECTPEVFDQMAVAFVGAANAA